MALPEHNPIDAGWFGRGIPIDHRGRQEFHCTTCGHERHGERYSAILGTFVGFGAPFFVAPFVKRRSTAGKAGGDRVEVIQCMVCDRLQPLDSASGEALSRYGIN